MTDSVGFRDMATFGEYNGRPLRVNATSEQIRHLLWQLDNSDPDGIEPPADTSSVDAKITRLALDDAIKGDYRLGSWDDQRPYRKLYEAYTSEALREYVQGPSRD